MYTARLELSAETVGAVKAIASFLQMPDVLSACDIFVENQSTKLDKQDNNGDNNSSCQNDGLGNSHLSRTAARQQMARPEQGTGCGEAPGNLGSEALKDTNRVVEKTKVAKEDDNQRVPEVIKVTGGEEVAMAKVTDRLQGKRVVGEVNQMVGEDNDLMIHENNVKKNMEMDVIMQEVGMKEEEELEKKRDREEKNSNNMLQCKFEMNMRQNKNATIHRQEEQQLDSESESEDTEAMEDEDCQDSAGSCEDVEIESAMYGSHPAEKQEEDENSGEGQGKEEELEQDIAGEDLGSGRARSYADRSESKVYSSTLHKCEVRNACMLRLPMK
uniref:Uncharacterized protein n=1 Tax=Eptatretus burgeri TaxID=7764 RepID=A0A8C4QMC0_EPTBU